MDAASNTSVTNGEGNISGEGTDSANICENRANGADAAITKKQAFLVVGLAGTGKTTFCQRLYSWLNAEVRSKDRAIPLKNGLNASITSINLDPAVNNAKMPLTVDIRDFIDYKETMEKYSLGPNGCINACLNIFLLNFQLPEESEYTIIDTPGQVEAFVWSSPGKAIAALFDNLYVLYVIDLELCKDKHVFMSNMLFAASIKCRYERPLLIVFNKSDLEGLDEVKSWIEDFESFKEKLEDEQNILGSLSLYFEEFYRNLDFVSVSSLTGAGKEEFFKRVHGGSKTGLVESIGDLKIKK